MGMCIPEEWGGAGTDFMSYSLAMEEIAAGWAAASSVMSVNNSPVCSALSWQCRTLLPKSMAVESSN